MQKKSVLYLVVLLNLTTGLTLSAQKKKNQYRDSSTVIIFSQSTKPSQVHKKAGEDNIIKIAPLGFISGTFPIYYERAFTEYFSVQGGLGLTNRNYYRGVSYAASDALDFTDNSSSSYNSDLADGLYKFDHRTTNMGFMFAIQPRFYFNSEGLDGSFFGVGYQNLRYNFEHEGVTGATGSDRSTAIYGGSAKSEHETMSDIFAVFGSQTLHDRISFESTLEMGIRKISGLKYVAYSSQVGSNYVVLDQNQFQEYSQTKFYFNIGIKVGYHF